MFRIEGSCINKLKILEVPFLCFHESAKWWRTNFTLNDMTTNVLSVIYVFIICQVFIVQAHWPIPSHMTICNQAYFLPKPYWPNNIIAYCSVSWCYYYDIILYYCDVILYYFLTEMSLRCYYRIWHHTMTLQ